MNIGDTWRNIDKKLEGRKNCGKCKMYINNSVGLALLACIVGLSEISTSLVIFLYLNTYPLDINYSHKDYAVYIIHIYTLIYIFILYIIYIYILHLPQYFLSSNFFTDRAHDVDPNVSSIFLQVSPIFILALTS